MANASFSLSVSSRGNDFVIGGSGALDLIGVGSLRQTIEESCRKEGASVLLDLSLVSDLHPEAVIHLAGVAKFCRDGGIPLSITLSPALEQVFKDAGYDAELMPLISGQ